MANCTIFVKAEIWDLKSECTTNQAFYCSLDGTLGFTWQRWCCSTRLGESSPTGNGAYTGVYPITTTNSGVSPSLRCRTGDTDAVEQHAPGVLRRLLHLLAFLLVILSGAPWQPPLTPGCESWCTQCTSQRCAVRGLHDLHVCIGCERAMTYSTSVGGGDPWAAPE